MATAAEPRPASLPLSGGRDGATVRLTPLLSGNSIAPPAMFHREDGRFAALRALGIRVPKDRWLKVPIVSFLLEHPGAGVVLVDTGLHPSCAVDPRQNFGRVGLLAFPDLEMQPSQAVGAQLRERGLDPADVSVVVLTHLHVDHASAISEFPGATFVFDGREWQAATAPRAVFHGYRRRQFDHAFDYRTLDFESSDADSFATFGRAYDLFGDGSVRVVSTPGHTLGHMSVAVRLRDGEALLCGDAAYTQRTLETSALPFRTEDEHLFRRSLREIQLYREQKPGALVVPGHDADAWAKLDPLYQ
jgi:N-acyl homoserine lactone hydrolase